MAAPATYSLLELNQYIRRVISLNFEEPVWIECEISQVAQSRGHWYLDLVQKDGHAIVAQCQAAIWANMYFYIRRKSPIPPEDILQQGLSVKLKVNVDYHERYGLKLIIEDIDTAFTVGALELQRQAILKVIKEKDLVRRNARMSLPTVIQRIAVISSGRAAGYKDFVKHLEDNFYGYHIHWDLIESAVQGQQVEADILAALLKAEKSKRPYDAVAIIRGGGSKLDLAAFDNLMLAERIAHFKIPVLIGIGHEIDQSVLDLVAHTSLKTPTAVADFIIEHNARFENEIASLAMTLRQVVKVRLEEEHLRLQQLSMELQHASRRRIEQSIQRLEHGKTGLQRVVAHYFVVQQQRVHHAMQMLQMADPQKVLARGYTITTADGKSVTSSTLIEKGMRLQTTFHDGTINSTAE